MNRMNEVLHVIANHVGEQHKGYTKKSKKLGQLIDISVIIAEFGP